jgi:Tol biopolymer transport system component
MGVLWLLLGAPAAAVGAGGSHAGKDWGVDRSSYEDPVTRARVWEVTRQPQVADNLYFHASNFTADNRHLIFVSDYGGSRQLFRCDLATGRVVQVTDDPGLAPYSACADPKDARRLYCLRGQTVLAVDLLDFSVRVVGEIPGPCIGGLQQVSLSGDGQWLALGKQRDKTNWEIGLMNAASGEYRTVLTQGFRIGHVQHCPTAPVIFYVWETGGYAPQRSWLVNTDGTGNRPFYSRTSPANWFTPLKEWVTHESWVKDTGEMIMVNDKLGIMVVQPDGSARIVREGSYWHAAARPDGKMLVMDDAQGRLWLAETATGNTRLLATGLRTKVPIHPHASFDRAGRYVQFHTGRTHETVAYIDLDALPPQSWSR